MKSKWMFDCLNLSRQAFDKWKNQVRVAKSRTEPKFVLKLAKKVKKLHLPGSGSRPIYHYIRSNSTYNEQLIGWGKHKFEKLCLENGMRITTRRYIPKTTIHGAFKFDNKIEGMIIYDIDRIWVSDICYIFGFYGDLIGYATSLIDIYSRLLLGLVFSETMRAKETIIPALSQVFRIRQKPKYQNTYFHSDGGKQFIANEFLKTLNSKEIKSSMARSCYENPFAESFNDILKNHILNGLCLTNFRGLKKQEAFIKYVYNFNKTHSGIDGKTPVEYEKELQKIKINERVGLEIKLID